MKEGEEVVELVYSIKEDLAGKYLEHGMRIGDVKNNAQKLYYNAVTKAFIQTMPLESLLSFSELVDSEINRRYGSGEFNYIKDSTC